MVVKGYKKIVAALLTVVFLLSAGFSAEAEESASVSGSDLPEIFSMIKTDISDMVFQAGGWGTPSVETPPAALYTISARDKLKSEILTALQEDADTLDVSSYLLDFDENADECQILLAEVLNEHPELFYVYPVLSFIYYQYSQTERRIQSLCFYYKNSYSDEDKQAYSRALQDATAMIEEDMTQEEKALALHDYLAQHCAYAYREYLDDTLTMESHVYDAFGALVKKRAVCQGYAEAYSALCNYVGIPCELVSSRPMNHAWNVVCIDGNWYHVDVTGDDPAWNLEGRARHKYFLVSDTEMENRGHYGWVDSVECSSGKYDAEQYWWTNVDSGIVQSGKQYFLTGIQGGLGFHLMEKDGDTVSVKYTNNTSWPVWDGSGWWTGPYAYLSRQGDYLYFNDKLHLYGMKPTDSEPHVLYTYEGGDGYIYGAMVYEDGTARLNIDTLPCRESDSYLVIDLKAAPPAVTADTERRILSTTTDMEYSIDNGATWKKCADNMGFAQFGWDGRREKVVLVRMEEAGGNAASEAVSVTLPPRQDLVIGMISSAGKETEQVTLRLLGGDGKLAAGITVTGSRIEYALENVAAGNYTLEISKKNHVARAYAVTKGNAQFVQDVEICLVGDVSGDGKLNAKDKRVIYSHVAGSSVLTGYLFEVGDVNSDGRINAKDKKLIYNHVAGTGLIWQ